MAMIFANMDLNGTSVAGSAVNVPKFPSEEPETKDFNEWIDCAGPVLQRAGHGPAMRGEMPPGLHQISFQMGMPELSKLSDEERAKVGPVEAVKHDRFSRGKHAQEGRGSNGLRLHHKGVQQQASGKS